MYVTGSGFKLQVSPSGATWDRDQDGFLLRGFFFYWGCVLADLFLPSSPGSSRIGVIDAMVIFSI